MLELLLKMVEQGELDSRKCKNNLKFRKEIELWGVI